MYISFEEFLQKLLTVTGDFKLTKTATNVVLSTNGHTYLSPELNLKDPNLIEQMFFLGQVAVIVRQRGIYVYG